MNYKLNNVEVTAEQIRELLEQNPEIMQKPNKRWRAELEEKYYYLDDDGDVNFSTEYNYSFDNFRYNIGNYFQTEKEAEAYRERLLAVKKIKDWALENASFEPDWEHGGQKKWVINYNHKNSSFQTDCWYTLQFQTELPSFKSDDDAKQCIKEMDQELRIVFGIK